MSTVVVVSSEAEKKLFVCDESFRVIVTGVGYGNVYRSLCGLPRDTTIINIGFAGSNSIPIGTLCCVGEVRNFHPNVDYSEMSYRLVGDTPCFSSSDFVTRADIPYPCLFDMELYAILSMGFTNVVSFKTVSDHLNYKEFENNV